LQSNTNEHNEIKVFITSIAERQDKLIEDHENRLKGLEFWKVGFVAKFGVYSAVAVFFGSLIGTLAVNWITNEFIK
jgi:mannose/fructose/N-acetylgalactosamine-specific phosphotransferase system component IIC